MRGKFSLRAPSLCLTVSAALFLTILWAQPILAQALAPSGPEWLTRMINDGWREVQQGVLERQLADGASETFTYGEEGRSFRVRRLRERINALQIEHSSHPSEDLSQILSTLRRQLALVEASPSVEISMSATSAEMAADCEATFGGQANAGPQTGAEAPGVTASANAFYSSCGDPGHTYAYAYARSTSGTTMNVRSQEDLKNNGTGLTSTTGASVSGNLDCFSQAAAMVMLGSAPSGPIYQADTTNYSCAVIVRASDKFNRPDASWIGPSWTLIYSGFSLSGGQALAFAGDGSIVRWSEPLGSADHYAQVTVREGHDVGVYVRMAGTTPSNMEFYSFRYFEAAQGWVLGRNRIGEGDRWLAYSAEPAPAHPYVVRLVAKGGTITGYVNGIQKVSASDSTLSHHGVGMFAHLQPRRADDFQAAALQAPQDAFDRSNTHWIGPSWSHIYGGFGISEGRVFAGDGDGSLARWIDPMDSADHFAELTVHKGHDLGVYVRMNSNDTVLGMDAYSFRYWAAAQGWSIVRTRAGENDTLIGFIAAAPPVHPYTIRLLARGANLVGSVNGAEVLSIIDNALSHHGVGLFASYGGSQGDMFRAGTWQP